ncbi:MAG: TetR/AcrR family transcriptional regulator [Hyphomonadaceae bacterium]|nr:TetR/AcrR family transcriptional regulator [Hyphomonadaceae bacterium]
MRTSDRTRPTQAQRREKAEQAILMAALQIIADRGIDELTLAEAGQLAGYSRALPAHYFASKDAALIALCDFVVEKYLQRVQRRIPGREGLEGFLERLEHYFDDGRKDPRILRAFHAILGASPGKPALAKSISGLAEASKATFCDFLRAGIARGEIRPDIVPEAEAVWILAALRGVMGQWLNDEEKTPLPKVRDAFVVSVRRALQA